MSTKIRDHFTRPCITLPSAVMLRSFSSLLLDPIRTWLMLKSCKSPSKPELGYVRRVIQEFLHCFKGWAEPSPSSTQVAPLIIHKEGVKRIRFTRLEFWIGWTRPPQTPKSIWFLIIHPSLHQFASWGLVCFLEMSCKFAFFSKLVGLVTISHINVLVWHKIK